MQSRATTHAALAPTLWTGNRAIQNVVLVLIGTAILGIVLLDEPANPGWLVSLGLIVAGIVALKLSSPV